MVDSDDIFSVVHYAYDMGGFQTRSNYARANAEAVAAASVRGLITTEIPRGGFGSTWRPTSFGIDAAFIGNGAPSSLYVHGGLPDAFMHSLERTLEHAH